MANPDHLSRLRGGVAAWNVWRDGRPLSEVDLRGADLSGLDLCGVDLWYARLQGARLTGALLSGAVLDRADLTLADLSNASCYGTRMRGIVADRTWMRGTALVHADLTLACIVRCELEATIFTGAKLLGANFWQSDLDRVFGLDPNAGWIAEEVAIAKEEHGEVERRAFGGFDTRDRGSAAS